MKILLFIIVTTCGKPDMVIFQTENHPTSYGYWTDIIHSESALTQFKNLFLQTKEQNKIVIIPDDRGLCV